MIDGPFSLSEAANAVQYFGQGKHQGKVILSVSKRENEFD